MKVYSWASVYFVSFVIVSGFIMINVVVGIVVGTIDESQKELEAELEAERRKNDTEEQISLAKELEEVKTHLAEVERLLALQNEAQKPDKIE